MYVDSAKIYFMIKDKKEKFYFKNRILQSPSHPQKAYLPKEQSEQEEEQSEEEEE